MTLGQWDTSVDNVLLTDYKKLLAVDNDATSYVQQVHSYGSDHFIRLFRTNLENEGSIAEPIVVDGTGAEVLATLDRVFGDNLPQHRKAILEKKANIFTSFDYFIENNRVWKQCNDPLIKLNYFTENITQPILKQFQNIDCKIFDCFINEVVDKINDDQLLELQLTRDTLAETLSGHFSIICSGIHERYGLVEDYVSFCDGIVN